MFERFGKAARLVVRDAVYLAEQDKAAAVWPEHLLLSMLRQDGSTGTTILANYAVTTESVNAAIKIAGRRGGLSESESAALAGLGIDVDAIVTAVEEAHGPGALAGGRKRQRTRRTPFSRESKKVLERTLKEAVDRRDSTLGDEHILLALISTGGIAADVLAAQDVTHAGVLSYLSRAVTG
ncbi:MAG: peptidase [Actinomycetota bacterium]|nr:peptidase [Actinomycetota bacterium]